MADAVLAATGRDPSAYCATGWSMNCMNMGRTVFTLLAEARSMVRPALLHIALEPDGAANRDVEQGIA